MSDERFLTSDSISREGGGMIANRLCLLLTICLFVATIACSTATQNAGDYKIALTPARRGQNGIFVMNADTTGGRLLTPDPGAQLRLPSWSPDGKKIAFFTTRSKDAEILAAYRMPFHYLLYVMNAAGGTEKMPLDFPISDFEWSPNSRQLLYISAYEDPQRNDLDILKGTKMPLSAIYILDLQTDERKRLTSFGKNCSGSWSPDSTQLALSFGTDQKSDIYTATLDGKHTRRITDSETINIKPAWSPDSKSIVYISVSPQGAADQDAGVYIMDAAGTNKRRLSSIAAFRVTWAPNGKLLLLESAAGVVLTDLSGEKTINPIPHQVGRPLDAQFTPDGRAIAFRSNHEGEWHLYTVDLPGKNLRRITGKLSSATYCLSPLQSKG
jgi:Tol biopolymer transport system component